MKKCWILWKKILSIHIQVNKLKPLEFDSPTYMYLRRFLKVLASEIKSGDHIIFKSRLSKVNVVSHSHLGRSGATLKFQIGDLKNLGSTSFTCRPSESIELVEIEWHTCSIVSISDGEAVLKSENEIEYVLDESLIPTFSFLQIDMLIKIGVYDKEVVSVKMPTHSIYKITHVENSGSADRKKGIKFSWMILESGARIKAPGFLKAGDQIEVNLSKLTYQRRI
eukprot:NODE_21_length_42443_cov_0.822808.p25 type:complete len:223 gc:universal NODE_21_length_42443_cov_0.822808:21982-22650(+)